MTAFIHGTSYASLRRAAFERADEIAGEGLASIRWLGHNDHLENEITDAWAESRSPLRLTISSLDNLAGEYLERRTGPRQLLDTLTRRQLIDNALRQLDGEAVLDEAHRYRGEITDLFSALEGAGHDSPEAIHKLVSASSVSGKAETVLVETYRHYQQLRSAVTTTEEYTGFQALQEASGDDLSAVFPSIDVIVLSNYYELTPLQQRFVERLAEDFELVVTLPWVETPGDRDGANDFAADTRSFYADLADDVEFVTKADDTLSAVAGALYTPDPSHAPEPTTDQLRWVEAPTPDREIRQVARSIKHRSATESGFSQDNALVVVPGLISYREHVEDIFGAHGLTPVTFVNKLLYQTNAGRAMLDLVALCADEDAGTEIVNSLASNPVLDHGFDAGVIAEYSRALPGNDIDSLRNELGPSNTEALDELLEGVSAVSDATGAAVVTAVRELFGSVGLDADEPLFEGATGFDAMIEKRAVRRVSRALDAIERVAGETGHDSVLELIADELDQIRIPPPSQTTDGVLEVAGPREALGQSYDHLYMVGMTARDFPPDPDRPVFFEDLWDGLEGVEPTDHRGLARYQFATMLASANSVYITTPESTVDGDPLIESSVLDELRRVADIEPMTDDLGNGYREDAQRAVSRSREQSASNAVNQMIASGVFDDEEGSRVQSGVECAKHRASPNRTDHDGLLEPETIDALYPAAVREPYSPSQLTDYAKCGFRFLMERVLDVEEPREYKLEPDPLDVGTLVHDTLEYFYTGLQSEPGDHVDLSSYSLETLEKQLLQAGERAVEEADLPYDDAFYQRQLESLFAGLCDADRNPYYGDSGDVHGLEEGLFAKFLAAERERGPGAGPGWFEIKLDLSNDEEGAIDLELPDGRSVPVGGKIDRVTVDQTDDPPTGLVHDYKTGGGDLRETVDGVTFQLSMYALAAGEALEGDGVETPFDAAFYTLNHDDFGDGWTLSYYLYREGDSDDAEDHYRRLVEEETPRRIGEIIDGIGTGAFQPSVLSEDTAGCRHCAFSDVCDVRYHMRREVVTAMDGEDRPGYAPQYARERSFLDNGGVDE